ncbi:Hypothetical protein SRAE_X000011000 [Strongyloides ratti]|uniref:Uncharacterized protein n=1 Tax=Strongyloides ratti TaxID=34506 RepID=A0A090LT59_STRRB|nr:Hypothetical protein SRAE_X000011000 [Strongyloides ratti]CEF70779.1 Hypothetical protein SRAE_X000011000 [Strongyloides ratti]
MERKSNMSFFVPKTFNPLLISVSDDNTDRICGYKYGNEDINVNDDESDILVEDLEATTIISSDSNLESSKKKRLMVSGNKISENESLLELYRTSSERYNNVNWDTHLKKLFSDSDFLQVLKKFKISISLLKRIVKKKHTSCDIFRQTFLSFNAIYYLDIFTRHSFGYCEIQLKNILCIIIKHYLICYYEDIDGVTFLKSIEDRFLSIISRPLSFGVRKLLFIYVILLASSKGSKMKYNIECESIKRLISYNITMPKYVELPRLEFEEEVKEATDLRFRMMIKTFKNEFCN